LISLDRITALAHQTVRLVICKGDRVVDATAGNGYDTIMLAEEVGPEGRVYAFEIQKEALCKVAESLKQQKLDQRVTLIHSGHEYLLENIKEQVSVVMYNLGYLPGGDRQVTTTYDTTIESFKQALTLLKPGGIITIVLYPGHKPGADEKNNLLPFCQKLDSSKYVVLYNRLLNQDNDPPELLVVQKKLFYTELSS